MYPGIHAATQPDKPAVIMGRARRDDHLLGMDDTSVYLCPAPLYHSAGLQWSVGAHELGGTVVLMEKFDAEYPRRSRT